MQLVVGRQPPNGVRHRRDVERVEEQARVLDLVGQGGRGRARDGQPLQPRFEYREAVRLEQRRHHQEPR